ncbi:MAG: CpsD/CapB family tyrosine-protein kinase [Clostridiales bacterium]|nr:CpsD/CapB family tyrosine-protein kinase [Clostridiales bacterium]
MNSLTFSKFPALGYASAEAFNTLCTNLSFSGENVRKIMITSSHAGEGKSTTSMNIMRTLAKLGKTVVLVDADLRRSMITSKYGVQFADTNATSGLAHMLAGMADADDVIYKTNIPGAFMVPVGREVSNPLPLLNSPRFGQMLDLLAGKVDYVIVDAPPVGTVIDAAQIAKYCDGTLIVVGYNTVRRQELMSAKAQLEQTECPILGTVLNMVEYDNYMNKNYYYKSYYSYYTNYANEDGNAPTKKRKGLLHRK